MSCGIMRIEKRNRQAIYGIKIESCRTKQDHERGRDFMRSDIDWNRTDFNTYLIKTDNWMEKIDILTAGLRKRKDSVLLLDGIYTASPEFFKDISDFELRQYFEDCLQFHIKELCAGNRNLVVSAVIHFDESTPHLHVASVPIIEKPDGTRALSAKEVMGNVAQYRQRQDRFYEQVSSEYGLERGDKSDVKEKRRHLDKLDYTIAEKEKHLQDIESATADNELLEESMRQRVDEFEKALSSAKKKYAELEEGIKTKKAEYDRMYNKVYNAQRFYGSDDYAKQMLIDKINELQDELLQYRKKYGREGLHMERNDRTGGRDERPHKPTKGYDIDR